MPESWKANMAAGAVVVGLMPSILALTGSSTVELGLLFFQRPLLAFLLGMGTPAITPIRTFEYRDPAELLHKRRDGPVELKLSRQVAKIILALQYVLVCAALFNMAYTTWQLSIFCVTSFAPATQYLPALWVVLAIAIHLFGTAAVALRVDLTLHESSKSKKAVKIFFPHDELNLCVHHAKAHLTLRQESYAFIFFSWIASMATILHITFGTLIFLSILFISSGDAIVVSGRLLASTAVCRIILMFEINGMRQIVDVIDSEEETHRPRIYE